MEQPQGDPSFLEFVVPHAVGWAREQRDRYRDHPDATPLPPNVRAWLEASFPREILDGTRFITTGRFLDRPAFFDELVARFGISEAQLQPFLRPAGMTFGDVVVLTSAFPSTKLASLRLCFHELVHAVQYAELGIEVFMQRYVEGWLKSGGVYENIPLEQMAYELDARFSAGPHQPFDAAAEVRRTLEVWRYYPLLPPLE